MRQQSRRTVTRSTSVRGCRASLGPEELPGEEIHTAKIHTAKIGCHQIRTDEIDLHLWMLFPPSIPSSSAFQQKSHMFRIHPIPTS